MTSATIRSSGGTGHRIEGHGLLIFASVLLMVLGLFNLLPIPPLDGGRIVVGLLPARLAQGWAKMERFGIVLVLLLVFLLPRMLADFGIAFDPFSALLNTVVPWALRIVLLLAGHDVGASDAATL